MARKKTADMNPEELAKYREYMRRKKAESRKKKPDVYDEKSRLRTQRYRERQRLEAALLKEAGEFVDSVGFDVVGALEFMRKNAECTQEPEKVKSIDQLLKKILDSLEK